jgi:hypothetical protein
MAGWAGQVLDAHDESPIVGARVDVVGPAGTFGSACDGGGSFRIEPFVGSSVATLRVSAPWHATLVRSLPPPGRLTIALSTRRRALLARLVEVGGRLRGREAKVADPTPAELARHAAEASRGDLAVWARAVEGAAYGPESIDAEREAAVSALEPRDL